MSTKYKCECGKVYVSPVTLSAPPVCTTDKKTGKPHLRGGKEMKKV